MTRSPHIQTLLLCSLALASVLMSTCSPRSPEESTTDNALQISLKKPLPQLLQPPVLRADMTRQPHIKLPDTKTIGCLKLQPSVLRFEPQKAGCKAQEQVLRVLHTNAPGCDTIATISKLSLIQQEDSPFHLRAIPKVPITLQKNQFFTLRVGYRPQAEGTHFGTISIEHGNKARSNLSILMAGQTTQQDEYTETFRQITRPKRDILIVIDNSRSMAEEQQLLASELRAFIAWVVRLNVDYQIMVTTTHTTGTQLPPGCAHQGFGSTTHLITPGTPNPETTFVANTQVGFHKTSLGKGLEVAYKALSPPALTGCNRGFLRKDARLDITFISDRADMSSRSVNFYTTFFRSLKGPKNADQIRASVVVGPPGNCNNPATGNASHGPRYIAIANDLNGVVESICNKNWANTLMSIGSLLFRRYRKQFYLSRRADPTTIDVQINRKVIQKGVDGWRYDPVTNSILFSQSTIPPPGGTITVRYKTPCFP